MKCECCNLDKSDVKTLTLCDSCFHEVADKTENLLIENFLLKQFIKFLLFRKVAK